MADIGDQLNRDQRGVQERSFLFSVECSLPYTGLSVREAGKVSHFLSHYIEVTTLVLNQCLVIFTVHYICLISLISACIIFVLFL